MGRVLVVVMTAAIIVAMGLWLTENAHSIITDAVIKTIELSGHSSQLAEYLNQ